MPLTALGAGSLDVHSHPIRVGADLLSAAGYDVYVPDFFKGGHLDKAAFPHMQKHEQ